MNILLTSIGRRGLIVKYFQEAVAKNGGGKVYTADADFTAPAMHLSDGFFLVPKITERNYVDSLVEICAQRQITAVLSFIDPELEVLARKRDRFAKVGTKVLVPDAHVVEVCYDKYKTYEFLRLHNVPTANTCNDLDLCIERIESSKLCFPLIVKPIRGSGSVDVQRVDSIEELNFFCKKLKNYVIQEYFATAEYGVDVLRDLQGEVVAVFARRKLRRRGGEADRVVSVNDSRLLDLGVKVGELIGGAGPLDIDVFERDDRFVVIEINPRFGGAYPSAYECGVDFMDMIIKMLQGKRVAKNIGDYEGNVYSAKHDQIAVFRAA